jgi:hypothetical protein
MADWLGFDAAPICDSERLRAKTLRRSIASQAQGTGVFPVRNFQKIAEGIDTIPLVIGLAKHAHLWSENGLRQTFSENSPHREVDDILLRFNTNLDLAVVGDDLECVWQPAGDILSFVKPLVLDLMRRVGGERLGRVMITRLAPQKQIYPHSDVLGAYAAYYSRLHFVIQSLPGAVFHAGDEAVHMRPGEVWNFNAHAPHWVINNSIDDRLHLICDVRIP